MTEFNIPPLSQIQNPETQPDPWDTATQSALARFPYTFENPEYETNREIENRKIYKPDLDIGFFGKAYNAFAEETVLGQAVSDIFSPSFSSSGYTPSKEDLAKFGGDLEPETLERISSSVSSFEEFLYEIDQARITQKRRIELFSGGVSGFATGMGLTILAAGGEATVASLLLGSLTGGAAAPGTATAGAANVATATMRARRIQGMLRAAGSAAAIDIPLEGFRYGLDKTLTPADLIINMGASVTLAGSLGAWKPDKFLGKLASAADEAKIQQAADYARAKGDTDTADALDGVVRNRIRVKPLLNPEDATEEVGNMSVTEVRKAAKERGIKVRETKYISAIEYNRREASKLIKSEDATYKVQRRRPSNRKKPLTLEEEQKLAVKEAEEIELDEFGTSQLTESGRRFRHEVFAFEEEVARLKENLQVALRKDESTTLRELDEQLALREKDVAFFKDQLETAKQAAAKADYDQRPAKIVKGLDEQANNAEKALKQVIREAKDIEKLREQVVEEIVEDKRLLELIEKNPAKALGMVDQAHYDEVRRLFNEGGGDMPARKDLFENELTENAKQMHPMARKLQRNKRAARRKQIFDEIMRKKNRNRKARERAAWKRGERKTPPVTPEPEETISPPFGRLLGQETTFGKSGKELPPVQREITLEDGKKITVNERGRVRTQPMRDIGEVRKDLADAINAERAVTAVQAEKAVAEQISRKWANLNTPAKRRRFASTLGVTGAALRKGGDALKKAVIKKAVAAAKRGFAITGEVGRPSGVKLNKVSKYKGVEIKLTGNLERMLFKLSTARGENAKEVRKKITEYLQSQGIENPQSLADEFVEKVRGEVKKRPKAKQYKADASKMELEHAVRKRPDGIPYKPELGDPLFGEPREIDFKVDEDLFEGSSVRKDDPNLDPEDIDDLNSPSVSEQTETSITDGDGETLAVGPDDGVNFVEPDMKNYVTPDQGGSSGKGKGMREAFARWVSRTGSGKTPFSLARIPFFGKLLYKAFTPIYDRFTDSASDDVRRFAAVFFDSAFGKGESSVMSVARTNFERMVGELTDKIETARMAAKRAGSELTDYDLIRMVRAGEMPDGPAGVAVDAIRNYFKKILKYAKDNGLPVEGVPDSPNYFPRNWNPSKYAAVVDKLGGGDYKLGKTKLQTFLRNSIVSGSRGKKVKMSKPVANKIAKRIIDYMENPEAKRDWNGTMRTLNNIKEELIKDLSEIQDDIAAEAGGITALAEDVMGIIAPRVDENPHVSFGRRRIDLDELYEENIDGVLVRLDDLTDMDLNLVTRRYGQQAIGAVSARKGMEAAFGDANMTLSQVKERLKRTAREAGEDEKTANFYVDAAEVGYKMITGQQVFSKKMMKYAQVSNMLSQGTMGMTLGFAQIPEMANIVFRTSFKAAMSQFSLSDIGRTFKMGLRRTSSPRLRQEANELSSCLEAVTGIGGDYARGDHFMRRMDDIGFDDDYLNNSWWGRHLDAGRLFASLNPLGIMPMDTFMRRWAARASFQHFVNKAYDVGADGTVRLSKGWWENSVERFGQLGMSPSDIDRVSKILSNPEYVTLSKGMFGNYYVKNFDFSKVEDKAIVDKLIMAIRRNTDSMIQRQTFGEMPMWMNTDVGKLLSQFRVFTVVAKSKQLAAGIARGDMKEMGNVMGGAFLAMMGYKAVTYYRSLGQADPEAYWAEKTTDERLIKSAIMRSGYASILPALIDSVAPFVTESGEGIFDSSMRTTGLAVDPLMGSTAMSNIERLKDVAGSSLDAMFKNRDFTQRDLKQIQSLWWMAKIPGIDQLLSKHFISQAPISNR